MHKFSIGEALRFGWDTMKANFWYFVVVLLIVIGLEVVLPGLMGGFSQNKEFSLMRLVSSLVSGVIGVILSVGLIKLALMFVDGQKPEYSELFAHANLFWKYLGTQILVSFIMFLGFLLLIIPGFIWAVKYSFACYFVADKGMGPGEALKHSGLVTNGEKWRLFLFGITLGLINIAGAVVLGIGLFATVPTSLLAMAFVYRKLSASLEPVVVAQQ